jgi:hypothetical protein
MVVLAALLQRLFERHCFGAGPLIVLAAAALVCVLPFTTHDPTAYTNRGYIWQQSLLAWSGDKVLGLGSAWYAIIGSSSAALGTTVFHGHNQLVQLLVPSWRRFGAELATVPRGRVRLTALARNVSWRRCLRSRLVRVARPRRRAAA